MIYLLSPEAGTLLAIVLLLGGIAWVFIAGTKGAWQSITNPAPRYSGCNVTLSDDGKFWRLFYSGPNDHIEISNVPHCSARNHVVSLSYDLCVFEAHIRCKDYDGSTVLREEKVKALTIKELSAIIEEQFKAWDSADGLLFLWNDFYLNL